MTGELAPCSVVDIPGWRAHDHAGALNSFKRSCREILDAGSGFVRQPQFGGCRSDWQAVCEAGLGADAARRFFEDWFVACRVMDAARPEGMFTGYFEPEVEGSRMPSADCQVPIYRPPADLTIFTEDERVRSGFSAGRRLGGEPAAYLTRRQIEEGALAGQGLEIAWVRDWADAFFIHVQGSGRIRLREGGSLRLTFAAKSGHAYTSIGSRLVEKGAVSRDEMSMQSIRAWMTQNPGKARALMWENESFIFFREAELDDPSLGALGAQHVQLTPRRSLAIDHSYWMYGTPIWLDTEVPAGNGGAMQPFRQLLIAQDTGSAIRGMARGDVYWGCGEAAGLVAGPMKSPGIMTVLLPRPVAQGLGLVS